MERYRRLPLTGRATNVRDLGGYAGEGGRAVRFGRFLRSDNPAGYSKEDVALLRAYGVKTVVDLRSAPEREAHPHPLPGLEGIEAHAFSIADVDQAMEGAKDIPTLGTVYITMVTQSREWLRSVLSAMAGAGEGAVLFNCTAGKDRTGIVAAALLSIAGVAQQDIVADYALSRVYMDEKIKMLKPQIGLFADAPPEAMQDLLSYLDEHEGGAVAFLQKAGVRENEIAALKARLLDD